MSCAPSFCARRCGHTPTVSNRAPTNGTRFTRAQIAVEIARLAGEISRDHEDGVVLVGVLKGALPFLADLMRALTVVPEIDFLSISPYRAGSGRVRLMMDLRTDINSRAVVLVDDVVDTGLTLAFLLSELATRGPASLDVCTLFDKVSRRLAPVPLRYRGFPVADQYLIGFGLDHEGRYRDTHDVVAVDRERLVKEPDSAVSLLYPDARAQIGREG